MPWRSCWLIFLCEVTCCWSLQDNWGLLQNRYWLDFAFQWLADCLRINASFLTWILFRISSEYFLSCVIVVKGLFVLRGQCYQWFEQGIIAVQWRDVQAPVSMFHCIQLCSTVTAECQNRLGGLGVLQHFYKAEQNTNRASKGIPSRRRGTDPVTHLCCTLMEEQSLSLSSPGGGKRETCHRDREMKRSCCWGTDPKEWRKAIAKWLRLENISKMIESKC